MLSLKSRSQLFSIKDGSCKLKRETTSQRIALRNLSSFITSVRFSPDLFFCDFWSLEACPRIIFLYKKYSICGSYVKT